MGHGTDTAITLGLCGYRPSTVDPDQIPSVIATVRETQRIALGTLTPEFVFARDLIFNRTDLLPKHSNGMRFTAYDATHITIASEIFYSIGGGFVISESEAREAVPETADPLPFACATDMLALCDAK